MSFQDDEVICHLKQHVWETFPFLHIMVVPLEFVSHAHIPFSSKVIVVAFSARGPLKQTGEASWPASPTAFAWPVASGDEEQGWVAF